MVPLIALVLVGCSEYGLKAEKNKQKQPGTDAYAGGDPWDPGAGGDGDGTGGDGDGTGDGTGDENGGSQEDQACEDLYDDLTGTWDVSSRMALGDAVPSWVAIVGDGAGYACDWIGSDPQSMGLPRWAPDLMCIVADVEDLLQDMEVGHQIKLTQTGDKAWLASDRWSTITFDPEGEAYATTMDDMDCAFDPEPFEVSMTCEGDVDFSGRSVDMPIDGLIILALDFAACQAMDHTGGCSWRKALDQMCADVDWTLAWACEAIVDELAAPDACIDIMELDLEGTATANQAGTRLTGTWDGSWVGSDFEGGFSAQKP